MRLFGGKPGDAAGDVGEESALQRPATLRRGAAAKRDAASSAGRAGKGEDKPMAQIGKSISIHGDLTGNEDLLLEGTVEGKVSLPNNELTIGANGTIPADVNAKSVIVIGHVRGNVNGTERVEIHASGIVEGDVRTPRLIVAGGAVLNGSSLMTETSAEKAAEKTTTPQAETPSKRASGPSPRPPGGTFATGAT